MQNQTTNNQSDGTNIVIQGRMVWGGVKATQKKVFGSNVPMIDQKTGQPVIEYVFGLAVPKPSPQSNQNEVENFQKLWMALCTEGGKLGFPNPGQGNFAWKFVDGDGRKDDGSPYPEHSRGCYVVTCSTRIPLRLLAWQPNGQIIPITEEEIKAGYYVQVSLNVSGHGNPNAGLYVNPSYVARIGFGPEIVNAPDPTTIFGNTPPPMPFGASATPMGGGQLPVFNPGGGSNAAVPQQPGGQPTWNPANLPGMGNNGSGQPGSNGGMGGQTQPPTYTPNYGPLPTQFQQPGGPAQGGGNSSGTGGNPQPGNQPMASPGAQGYNQQSGYQQANSGANQWQPNGQNMGVQNSYGGPGPAMGQGQPSQGMPMQGMPGQWNPNGQ